MPRLDPPVINNCLWVYQDRSAMGPIENGIAAASGLVTDPSRSWEERDRHPKDASPVSRQPDCTCKNTVQSLHSLDHTLTKRTNRDPHWVSIKKI